MLGRGLLTNPALAEDAMQICNQKETGSMAENGETALTIERIRAFHEDVLEGYRKAIPGDKNVLFKMKELWFYMGTLFANNKKYLKKIKKSEKCIVYERAVAELF